MLTFLKRSHKLLANGKLAIAPRPRHIQQLMKLTGVKATSKPKRVPGDAVMEEVDNSEKLGDVEASEYRSCVGILLYLATGLPHAQHSMRHLSTGMSSPTKQLKDVIRHLVSFLSGTKDLHLCLDFRGDDAGLHHCYTQHANEVHLEVFSDSDWGSNKQHRKSVSAGFVMGVLCFSLLAGLSVWYPFHQQKLKFMLHLLRRVMEFSSVNLWHFA